MNRQALITAVLICASIVAAPAPFTHAPIQSPTADTSVTVPFELVNRHIILKVRVNDSRPLSFVLDTGDKFAIIDILRATELGLSLQGEVRMRGAGADTPLGFFVQNSSFTIPEIAGFSQPIRLALPLSKMAPRLGQDFDGIIGADFIKQFVVEIDYETQRIKLHNKDQFVYSGAGESIPVQINSAGHPILEADVTPIGGKTFRGKFILDIGSGGALALHSPFVRERNLLSSNLKTIKAIGAGAGGDILGRIGRVSELKIGKFSIKNPITMFSEDKAGAFANPALLGNIGQQIAGRFKLLLDYDRDRIILEPNASFGDAFDRAFDGLSVQAEGKDYRIFRVKEVLPDSPGSEAGLQKDDVITAVNGTPATRLTLTKLRDMFEQPATYKVTIQRGEQTLVATLTPRKML